MCCHRHPTPNVVLCSEPLHALTESMLFIAMSTLEELDALSLSLQIAQVTGLEWLVMTYVLHNWKRGKARGLADVEQSTE